MEYYGLVKKKAMEFGWNAIELVNEIAPLQLMQRGLITYYNVSSVLVILLLESGITHLKIRYIYLYC